MDKYNPKKIEKKWQEKWAKSGIYETKDSVKGKKNYMLLTEFPYPSGNLHIGHWFAFAVPDILARYHRLKGKNMMYPMGFDAFGLPAENAAIKRGLNPRKWTEQNIRHMAGQFATMGGSFDWSRKVSTIDPQYYKWTQWIFLKMLEKGLAQKSETTVNWCPKDKTVLANEQVVDNCCERCDTPVVQRKMEQWTLKITDYADRLIDDIEGLDWPESTKLAQKNWIGRSEGAMVIFKVKPSKFLRFDLKNELEVFTTRLDTICGCTYCVVAPEHELISKLKDQITNYKEVEKYIAKAKKKTELQRTELAKEKTGVELKGVKAVNPFTNEAVPVFVADYVLASYGTGAVMAVPAHDERDFEFAKKYRLPVRQVIAPLYEGKGDDKPVKEEPRNERGVVIVIIKHWKEDKFLCLNWEKFYWKTFVIGGIEKGESSERAAVREMTEETGYKSIKLIKKINGEIHENFNARHKRVGNRYIKCECFYIELRNGDQEKTLPEHTKNHKYVWIEKNKVAKSLNIEVHAKYWDYLLNGEEAFVYDGILIDAGKYSGLTSEKAREEMVKWLEKNKLGKRTKTYRLHDWVISRQRYWGVPIPVVYCEHCAKNFPKARLFPSKSSTLGIPQSQALENFAIVPVPEKDLPVELPNLKDFHPTGDGKSPLAKARKWVNVKCPKCKGSAKRETDTMDTFVDSSWYFIRYADPKNKKSFADKAKMKKWLPVPMYIGGAEHNTMHLLYSRFFTKVLFDLGLVHFNEPFTGRRNHGIILGPDNQKMSKSRGNVVDPDAEVKKWGADSVRMYLAFMGSYDQNASWQMTGIVGMRRFLDRVWKLKSVISDQGSVNGKLGNLVHKTIKKVTEDIENLRFNTAISTLMILLNEFEKQEKLFTVHYSLFTQLLSPFAPHIAEEIWREKLGHKKSIFGEIWPEYDPKLVRDEETNIVIQVNGKVRDQITVSADAKENDIKKSALASEKIKKYVPNIDNIKKIIFVPGRLINFVV